MRRLVDQLAAALIVGCAALALIPVACLLWLGFSLADVLCGLLTKPRHDVEPAPAPRDVRSASIMILSWNGRPFLERLLPSLRRAVLHHGGDHEVILVDNGSDDDSIAFTTTHFPEVLVVRHSRNEKFVRGYNMALPSATRDILILLNNDMVVEQDFLGPLLEPFAHPDVFAVASQIFFRDPAKRREETGFTRGRLSFGLLKLWHQDVPDGLGGYWPLLWAGGGAAAFDRRRFVAMGGFDPLFDPFYYEDTNASYEALKRGWLVLFAPRSRVVHEHRGTSGTRFSADYIARIQQRNQWLFLWRNMDSPALTAAVFLMLPFNFVRLALQRGRQRPMTAVLQQIRALAQAIVRSPQALLHRERMRTHQRRSDAAVLRYAASREPIDPLAR